MEPRGIAETDPKNKAVGTKTGREVTAGHVLNTYPHRRKVEIPGALAYRVFNNLLSRRRLYEYESRRPRQISLRASRRIPVQAGFSSKAGIHSLHLLSRTLKSADWLCRASEGHCAGDAFRLAREHGAERGQFPLRDVLEHHRLIAQSAPGSQVRAAAHVLPAPLS